MNPEPQSAIDMERICLFSDDFDFAGITKLTQYPFYLQMVIKGGLGAIVFCLYTSYRFRPENDIKKIRPEQYCRLQAIQHSIVLCSYDHVEKYEYVRRSKPEYLDYQCYQYSDISQESLSADINLTYEGEEKCWLFLEDLYLTHLKNKCS